MLGISVALLGYTYAGYPALIWALSRVRGRPVKKGPFAGGAAVLIAAHNEAESLPRKLENLLELAKTEPIREIWIGLDGCTDGTGERLKERIQNSEFRIQNGRPEIRQDEIRIANGPGEGIQNSEFRIQNGRAGNLQPEIGISNVQGEGIQDSGFRIQNGLTGILPSENRISKVQGEPGGEARSPRSEERPATIHHLPPTIQILEFEQRRGKAAVLNDLMARAGQSVFAMMDARQRVEAGAISALLENFADPQVGAASGALVYESAVGGAQKGAESYWGYEKFIRSCESRFWAVPGATGAFYAIRRELCRPIPENTLVDDVLIPMRAVLKGYRCLFEPSARVYDLPTTNFGLENLRKRRTLAGIWQILRLEPAIYCVFRNPIWFQWISHKFLRLLTPFLAILAVFSLGRMALEGPGAFRMLFWAVFAAFLASLLAFLGGKRIPSRGLGLLGAFFGVNWALLRAAWDAATGRFEARWTRRH